MTHSNTVYGTVRWMRVLRPVFDIVLLLAGLALFLYAQGSPDNIRQSAALSQATTVKPQAQAITYFEESHATEVAMWASFSNWLHTSESNTGSCKFEATTQEDTVTYGLLCAGKPVDQTQQSNRSKTGPAELPLQHVFVAPKTKPTLTSRKAVTKTPEKLEVSTPMVVQGWVNTPTGRKHFDPAKQRWIE